VSDFIPPSSLIETLTEECAFDKRRVANTDNFEIHYLDLTSLKLKVNPDSTPFLIPKRFANMSHITAAQLHELILVLEKEVGSGFSGGVLVLGGMLQTLKNVTQRTLVKNKVAVLARNQFQEAYQSANSAGLISALTTALVTALGRQALSPYHSTIPALAGSFFGRGPILKKVFDIQDNFTFVGNRRIGKTSLLQEIKHRLKISGKPVIIADLYGAVCSSTHEVLTQLLRDIDPSGNYERHSTTQDIGHVFHSTVARLARESTVVVFIDEIDKILAFDQRQSNELMERFRDVFHKANNTRFYAAGFRNAKSLMNDVKTPLYGFTKILELEVLTRAESKTMIELPLLNLGIDIRNSEIVEAIYGETAGHPELIQMCCAEVIRHVDETGGIPGPTDLLTQVFQSGDFREKVFGAFLANTHAPERLATYLLMKRGFKLGGTFDNFDFDIPTIDECLRSVGKQVATAELYTITENLLISGILVRRTGSNRFRFAIPQLARYCQNYGLEFMIRKALEEIGNLRSSWAEVLRGEPERKLL